VVTLKTKPTANYGWPLCEGPCGNPVYPACPCRNTTSPYVAPWLTYERPSCDVGAAVVGGHRYRGASFPPSYQGAYFYGDYSLNQIFYVHINVNDRPVLPAHLFSPADAITVMTFSPEVYIYMYIMFMYVCVYVCMRVCV
jgi:hypothetical protein